MLSVVATAPSLTVPGLVIFLMPGGIKTGTIVSNKKRLAMQTTGAKTYMTIPAYGSTFRSRSCNDSVAIFPISTLGRHWKAASDN